MLIDFARPVCTTVPQSSSASGLGGEADEPASERESGSQWMTASMIGTIGQSAKLVQLAACCIREGEMDRVTVH